MTIEYQYWQTIYLQGNIIIFDEGHNVEKMCEESASIELRSVDIALCVDEVTQVIFLNTCYKPLKSNESK